MCAYADGMGLPSSSCKCPPPPRSLPHKYVIPSHSSPFTTPPSTSILFPPESCLDNASSNLTPLQTALSFQSLYSTSTSLSIPAMPSPPTS